MIPLNRKVHRRKLSLSRNSALRARIPRGNLIFLKLKQPFSPAEGRARYRFPRALCSFALRDEPAFRKPLRVTRLVCVACRYSFCSRVLFFLAFSSTLLGDSYPLLLSLPPAAFTRAAPRPFFYAPYPLHPNEQLRAGSSTSLLIK